MFCALSIRKTHRNSKELHNSHMYQNFISGHFSNQSAIIVLVNWPRAHCGALQLTEASAPGPDSPRTSPRNVPVQWPSWTWCRTWWNHSWHSSRVTLNQRCFAFIRPRTPLVYRYHVISQTQSHSAVFGRSRASLFDSWSTSVLVGLIMDRTGGTDWRKHEVYIREYSPKTMNIVGVRTAHQC